MRLRRADHAIRMRSMPSTGVRRLPRSQRLRGVRALVVPAVHSGEDVRRLLGAVLPALSRLSRVPTVRRQRLHRVPAGRESLRLLSRAADLSGYALHTSRTHALHSNTRGQYLLIWRYWSCGTDGQRDMDGTQWVRTVAKRTSCSCCSTSGALKWQ